ncbi:MAG: hypothetical protein J6A25_00765 [Lachnospiraceae bacterium]|nr:hypothetical protein [Lachnospiraceae bacterium]
MSTETIDSRSLLKNVTVPDTLTSVPIHNQQRVAILREDIKELNDKVNILTGKTVPVISLKEIADRLTVSSNGESSLNLQDIVVNEVFEVTPKNTSTTYKYDEFDSGYVGLKSITQTIEVQLTGLQESTNIIIDKNFLETDGNIDFTSSETYFGAKKAEISIDIENEKEIIFDKTTDSLILPESSSAIGFKSIKIIPKLSNSPTIEEIKLALESTNSFEFIPTANELGYENFVIDLEEQNQTLDIISDSSFSNNFILKSIDIENSTSIVKENQKVSFIPSSNYVGIKSLTLEQPGLYTYTVPSINDLFITSSEQTHLVLKNSSTNYNIDSIIIPLIDRQNYTLDATTLSSAINNSTVKNTYEIAAPEGVVYDKITLTLPNIQTAVQDLRKDLGYLDIQVDAITPNCSLSALSLTDLLSSNLLLELSADVSLKPQKLKNLIKDNKTSNLDLSSSKISGLAAITDVDYRYEYSTLYLLNTYYDYFVQLALKLDESYKINLYQVNESNQNSSTPLLSFDYIGRQIKQTGDLIEELDSSAINIKFNPIFELSNTDDSENTVTPQISIIKDSEELTNAEILDFLGLALGDGESIKNNNNTPLFILECLRQNKKSFNYIIDNDQPTSTESVFSCTTGEQFIDDSEIKYKVLETLQYDNLTYNLVRTSNIPADFVGTYTGIIADLEDSYVYDFIVTEDTISFYALSRYEEVENTEDTTN